MSGTKRSVQQEGKSPKAEECHWENHFPGDCGEQTKQTQKGQESSSNGVSRSWEMDNK